MRELLKLATVLVLPWAASAQISYTGGTYTQSFDTLGTTGTNTPAGWFSGVGTNANVDGPLSIGNGSIGPTPGVPGWNYGNVGATDRSLGTASTGTDRVLELRIINNSGVDINAFELRFDGEMWRTANGTGTGAGNPYASLGASSALDNYVVLISTDNGANFTPLGSQFIYTVPRNTPFSTQTDGKAAANRVAGIGGSYALTSPVPNGGGIRLKWYDYNLVGPSDADIAIDNVIFRATTLIPVSVTQNPESTDGVQCGTVSFTAGASGSSPAIQWQKKSVGGTFIDVAGANALTLVVSNLVFPDDNGAEFRVHVSNSLNAVDSSPATLTVAQDTTAPTVAGVFGESDLINFTVTFSEAMDPGTVVDQRGYNIRSQDGLEVLTIASITPATPIAPTAVSILTTSPRDPNKNYVLAVNELGDATINEDCNPNLAVAPVIVPIAVSIQVIGINDTQIWRYFDDGTDPGPTWAEMDFDDLAWPLGTAPFGDPPDELLPMPIRTALTRGPQPDVADYPTAFFRTHFALPGPVAGAMLSIRTMVDDGLVLYLNGAQIWSSNVVTGASRTSYGGGVAGDIGSAYQGPFQLNVTNLVEGDNMLAAILYQNDATSSDWVFGIEVNAIVTSVSSGPVAFIIQPQPLTLNEGQTAAFSVSVEGSQPISFQWQKNTGGSFADLAGQTGASVVFPAATPADNGQYRVIASNSFGAVTSSDVTLTVNPDLVRPTLVSAAGSTNTSVVNLIFSRAISAATGGDPGNYSLIPVVGGAALAISGATVNGTDIALTTAPRAVGTTYQLTITGLRDTTATGNLIDPTPTIVNPLPQDILLLGYRTSSWRYSTNCQDGVAWNTSAFDDSSWSSGLGFFGLETNTSTLDTLPGGLNSIQTPLPIGATQLAYYFRTTFDWPNSTSGVQFLLNHYIDDGAVFYVNGSTSVVWNNNSNSIPPSCTALFDQPAGGDAVVIHTNLSGVASGLNHLAVEVHQTTTGSSDVLMGVELVARVTRLGAAGPRLVISDLGNNTVRITWSPAAGTLQSKNNLDDATWTDVPGQTVGNTVVLRDQLKRFYTVRQ